MSDPSVFIAVIAVVIGPTVVLVLTNRNTRASKREDWARQDAVAAQAKQDAAEATAAAQEVARLLALSTKGAAEDAAEIKAQLHAIHAFVNSDMTAALQAQLVALQGQLALIDDRPRHTPQTAQVVEAIKARVGELETTLADRAKAQAIADAAAAAAHPQAAADLAAAHAADVAHVAEAAAVTATAAAATATTAVATADAATTVADSLAAAAAAVPGVHPPPPEDPDVAS